MPAGGGQQQQQQQQQQVECLSMMMHRQYGGLWGMLQLAASSVDLAGHPAITQIHEYEVDQVLAEHAHMLNQPTQCML
jgi:hypothetical protein